MENHGLHFVALAQKLDDLVFADLIIVLGGGRPELHFLKLRALLMLALFVRLFVRLIKKFSVLGDLANLRVRIRRNLHQVRAALAGHAHRLERLHHAQLAAILVYYPNLPSSHAFVYPGTFCGSKTAFSEKPTSAAAP